MASADVAGILTGSRLVVLDFDGPITRLLPDPEYLELAAAAIGLVRQSGVQVPQEVAELTDHGAVLVEVGRRWPELLGRVEALSEVAELAAAGHRNPTPGAVELLRALRADGRATALVTNNCGACVHAFLDRFGLAELVDGVYGRVPGRADRLKPSPAMLHDAAASAGVPPCNAVMVGDSVTDIAAAAAAGMPGIGLTPDLERAAAMRRAGAVAVLEDTAALLAAYAAWP